MYVDNSWLSLDPIYLSLLHPHKFSDNFSDMDGFEDGGYIWAQGVLQYHLIEVPWIQLSYKQNWSRNRIQPFIKKKRGQIQIQQKNQTRIWLRKKSGSDIEEKPGAVSNLIKKMDLDL